MQDFFKLEYRSGNVKSLLTGERMHLVPTSWWEALGSAVLKELQDDGPPAIHIIGYSLGSALVDELRANIQDPTALTRHFTDFAAAAGWGVISMGGDLRQGKAYLVTVMNCMFCENEKLGRAPVCTFLASVVEGMADKVYGSQHRVSETRCSAMGEALCQFYVEESPPVSAAAQGDNPAAFSDWESFWASALPAILLAERNRATRS